MLVVVVVVVVAEVVVVLTEGLSGVLNLMYHLKFF